MNQANGKQPLSMRNKNQLLELLGEYDKTTGMTIKDFCKLHKVTEGAFYTARKRYRSAVMAKQASSRFIPITATAVNQPTGSLFAEVNGIKLYQPVPVDYLKSLIA
ncbi:MAG: hypothetical protein WKF89_09140 [Chitinophagaceae bacterium]